MRKENTCRNLKTTTHDYHRLTHFGSDGGTFTAIACNWPGQKKKRTGDREGILHFGDCISGHRWWNMCHACIVKTQGLETKKNGNRNQHGDWCSSKN
jgi:hypothetical protein